jgi:RNA polymerase sigma-70 factor, ECF subfamily
VEAQAVVARFPNDFARGCALGSGVGVAEPAARSAGASVPSSSRLERTEAERKSAPDAGGSATHSLPQNFAALYKEYFAFVWRTMAALGVAEPALDDAVQDAFVVVHRRLSEFEGRSSAKTWLFSIAHRVALNHRRRERRKGGLAELSPKLPCSAPDPLEATEHRQSWRLVEHFLDGLDDDRRAVFVLCLLEGASAPEASEALGVKVNTIYSRLHALRAAFRESLASEPEDPSHA